MNLPATKSFQPCPALIFFDMSTSTAERRYKRPVLPESISNELHAKQLEEIEHRLWVLCHHFEVFPEEKDTGPPPTKEPEPEMQAEVEELASVNPAKQLEKIVEEALKRDHEKLLSDIRSKQDHFLRKMFDVARLSQISQQAEQAQKATKAPNFDHSYSSLTEIKSTVITVRIAEDATSTTNIRDQYGIPWQVRLRQDMEWLVMDVDTSGCRNVMGRFKVLVRFQHASPLKTYPCNFSMDVSRMRTIYCGTLGSVAQLREDGYFASDDTLKLRVALVPMDPNAERSTLEMGKRLKQIPANHNANKMPKFAEGQLTIPDFLTAGGMICTPKLLDASRNGWQLVVALNQQNQDNNPHPKHMGITIQLTDGVVNPDTCHEYFIELLPVDPTSWSYRQSGRILDGLASMPEFLLKSRAEIYLKEGKLRIRWGVRRIPIR